ncbi:P-loop containing nucleoside triphosphate hydrolase protein [Phlyctochytrium arcticum]|nr:P-loop containing nucleoside triphosphate hydrolase protein [Phlyctochytrium arcticum]
MNQQGQPDNSPPSEKGSNGFLNIPDSGTAGTSTSHSNRSLDNRSSLGRGDDQHSIDPLRQMLQQTLTQEHDPSDQASQKSQQLALDPSAAEMPLTPRMQPRIKALSRTPSTRRNSLVMAIPPPRIPPRPGHEPPPTPPTARTGRGSIVSGSSLAPPPNTSSMPSSPLAASPINDFADRQADDDDRSRRESVFGGARSLTPTIQTAIDGYPSDQALSLNTAEMGYGRNPDTSVSPAPPPHVSTTNRRLSFQTAHNNPPANNGTSTSDNENLKMPSQNDSMLLGVRGLSGASSAGLGEGAATFIRKPSPSRHHPNLSTSTLARVDPSDPIVSLRNIHKTYLLGLEGVAALRGVTLKIQRGEWVAIYGTSGGGKTSLLNMIGTIDKPTKGELTVCDTVITPGTPDKVLAKLRLDKLGFVFQTFNLISSMTALENVELPAVLKGELSASERRARAIASLEKVGLGHRLKHFPAKLSGGEQQRVTIARAIANLPEVLLLDEPTGDLDTFNTNRIISLLHSLNVEHNMTLIMVTHDVHLKSHAHRVVSMRDGKVAKIEMVRTQRREEAMRELRANMQADTQRKASLADLGRAQEQQLQRQASNPIGLLPGESSHRPGRYVSYATEVREPGDYATYSSACGIPAVMPDAPIRVISTPLPQFAVDSAERKSTSTRKMENPIIDGQPRILRSAEDWEEIV